MKQWHSVRADVKILLHNHLKWMMRISVTNHQSELFMWCHDMFCTIIMLRGSGCEVEEVVDDWTPHVI